MTDGKGKKDTQLTLSDIKLKLEDHRRQRGTHKRKITIFSKKLREWREDNLLTPSLCKTQFKEIDLEREKVSI